MIDPLFQIHLSHSYFSDGVFQNCRIVAHSDTEEIASRYNLITHMSKGVFCLYTASQRDTKGFVGHLNDQLQDQPLRFLLCADESQFSFITDLPIDWVGQVEFSSKNIIADGSNIRLLPTLSSRLVNRQNVIGVISIYLEDLLVLECKNTRYVVDFQSRSVRWLYYLINRSQTKLSNPSIRNKKYVFEGPEPVVLPGGENGLCFNSGDKQFPLQQIPTLTFDLIDHLLVSMHAGGQTINHCLIQGLPTPKMEDLNRTGNSKKVVGAMYVYL